MKLVERFWAGVNYAIHIFTLSAVDYAEVQQRPLTPLLPTGHVADNNPIFSPPNGPNDFFCNYTAMTGWKDCSTSGNRQCWLRHTNGSEFNITTDYETVVPQGTLRKYHLSVTNNTIAPDGIDMTEAKLFNKTYPGPWLQACWGDEIEVTVDSFLKYNGTSVHWHGLRQLNNVLMDGVNGVTQCPIAPNDTFTYRFKATQYGTSWYHSHYSLQYGDGMLGPLTIFGPSSANYDEAKDPILLTDWGHRSGFQEFYQEIAAPPFPGGPVPPTPPKTNSILLNGRGKWLCDGPSKPPCGTPPTPYNTTFTKNKRYLMRIINTSVDTTFVFSIDNHNVTVVGSDFVPIHPYSNTSLLVGIGQRYHVIVEANPIDHGDGIPKDQNFWVRANPADGCSNFKDDSMLSTEVGIVRYDEKSTALPTSKSTTFSLKCSDETYTSLKPIIEWQVGRAVNPQGTSVFEAGLDLPSANPATPLPHGNLRRWSLGLNSLWLDFDEPTMLHVDTPSGNWDPELVIVDEDYTDGDWVYLVITATDAPFRQTPQSFVPASHPIHLHGHDFAVLEQSESPYWERQVNLKFDNPPRRDVALLPTNGYLVIAFKADNPGAWLMHCHIAWHASAGLALQILERQDFLNTTYPRGSPIMNATERTCRKWKTWHNDANNWWNENEFQDDSGI